MSEKVKALQTAIENDDADEIRAALKAFNVMDAAMLPYDLAKTAYEKLDIPFYEQNICEKNNG